MKRSDSTEMDRLLRRHAGRGVEALRAKGDVTVEAKSGAHLDADEMNAYAEGALPEATRSRYFAHLADCHDCRKLVTELTLAASRADEGKARVASLETTPAKSWRERLAIIFSPPVLRYGVPALALFAVIIVAIVAMRGNRNESGVALNVDQSRYSPQRVEGDSTTTAQSNTAQANTATGTAGNPSSANATPLEGLPNQQTQPDAAATPPPAANPTQMGDDAPVLSKSTLPKSETAPAADTKDASGEFSTTSKREQPEVAASASAPPPAPQETGRSRSTENEVASRDVREEQKKNKAAGKEDVDEMVVDGRNTGGMVGSQRAANEPRADAGRTTTARAAQGEARKRPPATAKSGPALSDKIGEKEVSTETRNVSGRQFRRQGSAWVDTAYNSSRPATSVARGSEQYRALVADEPALRTIAEQLGGEVIVVWKRRAYRFY